MEEKVFVFCPDCEEVVDGIGNGDSRDLITCSVCNKRITANWIGKLKYFKKEATKKLYMPEF